MSAEIPSSVEEITPDWLNQVVFPGETANKIVGLEVTPVGEGRGFLSETVSAGLAYQIPDPVDRPRSVIIKLQPRTGWNAEAEAEYHAFEREVAFYRDVAPTLPVRLPTVYYSESSPRGAIVVMENLSHLKGGDQVRGIPHSQALAVARHVARIHSAFWNNDAMRALHWAPELDHSSVHFYADQWPKFAEEFGLRIGREAVRVGEWIAGNIDLLEDRIAERPRSLIHGDLRADNLLLGEPDSTEQVVIVDWQLAARNLATIDIARLLGGSEPIPERTGHQFEVIREWHGGLKDGGVDSYMVDDAEHDFRLAALHCLIIPVKVHSHAGSNPSGRMGRLLDAMAQRFFANALEVEAEQALK